MSDTTVMNAIAWRTRRIQSAARHVNVCRRRVNMLHDGGDPVELTRAQDELRRANESLRAMKR